MINFLEMEKKLLSAKRIEWRMELLTSNRFSFHEITKMSNQKLASEIGKLRADRENIKANLRAL